MEIKSFKKEVIYKENYSSSNLYFVLYGKVSLIKKNIGQFKHCYTGESFGENSFCNGEKACHNLETANC